MIKQEIILYKDMYYPTSKNCLLFHAGCRI